MAVRIITVKSDRAVHEAELHKIQKILAESECPNESFLASIDGYSSFDENAGVVIIGAGEPFTAHVEI